MIDYFKASIRRKIARRYTKEYGASVDSFSLSRDGIINFANWDNPLVDRLKIKQENADFFRKFIRKGDLVIDIGTNIGDTTVPMAIAAGATGMTLGFDPNPVVFKILEINASLNKDKTNIVPFRYAVTSDEEEFYFISSEASFANGGISKSRESKHGRFIYPEKVRGVNLVNFLKSNYMEWLPKLSFIKVDAEGYDKEIIKSVSDLLATYKPVLVTESFGDNSEDEKYELFDVIAKHDYDIYYFSDFVTDADIVKLETRSDIVKWEKTINLYSVPR